MGTIVPGRTTHEHDGTVTVFLIGMRFNRLHRVDQWLPTFLAMPRMLAELYRNKAAAARGEADDLGFLEARTLLDGLGVTVLQYWRTPEQLYAYAAAPDHVHRPAWTAFNRRARGAAGAVGIWHETYAVAAGGHESVYLGMPVTGLATATRSVPIAESNRRHAAIAGNVPSAG